MDHRGVDRYPYPRAQLIAGWALANKAYVEGELALAGLATVTDLREWMAVRYALLVRSNASGFASAAEVIDKLNERAKLWLIDEESWGIGPDAEAGQRGMEALIAKQTPR